MPPNRTARIAPRSLNQDNGGLANAAPTRLESVLRVARCSTQAVSLSPWVDDPVATWLEDRPVIAVARDLLTSHAGKSKLKKAGREVFMLYIAATIQAPDEVWMVGTGQEGATMTRLARFRMGRDLLNVLAVFRRGAKVWSGVTAYQTYDGTYFNSKRTGNLCYLPSEAAIVSDPPPMSRTHRVYTASNGRQRNRSSFPTSASLAVARRLPRRRHSRHRIIRQEASRVCRGQSRERGGIAGAGHGCRRQSVGAGAR